MESPQRLRLLFWSLFRYQYLLSSVFHFIMFKIIFWKLYDFTKYIKISFSILLRQLLYLPIGTSHPSLPANKKIVQFILKIQSCGISILCGGCPHFFFFFYIVIFVDSQAFGPAWAWRTVCSSRCCTSSCGPIGKSERSTENAQQTWKI